MADFTNIQIGKDKKTSFPCLREQGKPDFVAFFPVTKLQVEEFLYSAELNKISADLQTAMEQRNKGRMLPGPKSSKMQTHALYPQSLPYQILRRMLLIDIPTTINETPIFPRSVARLARVPITSLNKENVLSVVATNLTLWNDSDELKVEKEDLFPTSKSEWYHIVNLWLKGRIPSDDDWDSTHLFYEQFFTKNLIDEVLNCGIEWPVTVEHLLRKLQSIENGIIEGKNGYNELDLKGLPFMNKGLYELVNADKKLPTREGELRKPLVAGNGTHDKAIWPTLSNEKFPAILKEDVPVVSVRAWFPESEVKDIKSLTLYL